MNKTGSLQKLSANALAAAQPLLKSLFWRKKSLITTITSVYMYLIHDGLVIGLHHVRIVEIVVHNDPDLSLLNRKSPFVKNIADHGLINHVDTKVKCRHLKTLT